MKSYSHFGLYLGKPSDKALVESVVDPDFFFYLEKHLGKLAEPVLLSDFIPSIKSNDELLLVGVSEKEVALFGQDWTLKEGYLTSKNYQAINSKDLLFSLAHKLNFPFPPSSLIKFKDLLNMPDDKFPYCIKFLNSAGGRGVFKVDEDKKILDFLDRQLEEQADSLVILKQEFVCAKKHFYTISHTDKGFCEGFEIRYDDKGNSRLHLRETTISESRSSLASSLGSELLKMNYKGPFGFDGFLSEDGIEYSAIDLNVRLDKSRIFHEILKRIDVEGKKVEFRRERFSLMSYSGFKEFYREKLKIIEERSALNDNNFQLIVLLCSNMFKEQKEKVMGEMTFLISRKLNSSEIEFEKWLNDCYLLLGINYDEK